MNETNVYGDVFRVGDIITFDEPRNEYEIMEIADDRWTVRHTANCKVFYRVSGWQVESATLVRGVPTPPPRPPKYSREEIVRMFVR